MPSALITGVTGQDGAYLSELLFKKGYTIVGLLQKSRPADLYRLEYLGVAHKIRFIEVDLLSKSEIQNVLEQEQPDEIYNLVGQSSVGHSFKTPVDTFVFNTQTVLNILEAVRIASPKSRFYQASSSEMFGNVGKTSLPLKESLLFHPASPYGISKASAHWLTVNYREAYKIKACCGILFNHESALRPENFVIKKIIHSAVEIKNGSIQKLVLGNLNVVRDFGYAPLYVDAMWRMMQQDNLSDYLICSGNQLGLNQLVDMVFNSLDLDVQKFVTSDPSLLRAVDLEVIYGDNSKAKRELGWHYTMSNEQLINTLIEDELKFMQWQKQRVLVV